MATVPDRERSDEEYTDENVVNVHQCTPERTVFTEEGNSDGWIATDLTVDLRR